MVDSLGYRMKFGVIAPSTNTSVEPEYALMQPEGITNHFCRIEIPDNPVRSDKEFEELLVNIRTATESAVDRVMTCDPGFVIMGMSAETFWDGEEGAAELHSKMEARAGVGVSLGSHACDHALKAYSEEKSISEITTYKISDALDHGFHEVASLVSDPLPIPCCQREEPGQSSTMCRLLFRLGSNPLLLLRDISPYSYPHNYPPNSEFVAPKF
mgnify:CR=1 FL=1